MMENPAIILASQCLNNLIMKESITPFLSEAAVKRGEEKKIQLDIAELFEELKEFQFLINANAEQKEDATIVTLVAMFANEILVDLVFTIHGDKIESFSAKKAATEQVKVSYVDEAKFEERTVNIGLNAYATEAKLTVGKQSTEKKVPAVVLTSFNNADGGVMQKPSKNIAQGLSSLYNFVTIRYKPRLHRIMEKQDFDTLMRLSIRESVLEDVFFALKYLFANAEALNIDTSKIFVMGVNNHGYFLPRVGQMQKFEPDLYGELPIAGFISVGSTSRPVYETALENLELQGKEMAAMITQEIGTMKQGLVSHLHNNGVSDQELVMGMPMYYWRNMYNKDQTLEAQLMLVDNNKKFLILHGEYDLTVTEKDIARWREVLAKHDATFKTYKRLNHMMVDCYKEEKAPTLADVEVSGAVDLQVIQDIAEYISQ